MGYRKCGFVLAILLTASTTSCGKCWLLCGDLGWDSDWQQDEWEDPGPTLEYTIEIQLLDDEPSILPERHYFLDQKLAVNYYLSGTKSIVSSTLYWDNKVLDEQEKLVMVESGGLGWGFDTYRTFDVSYTLDTRDVFPVSDAVYNTVELEFSAASTLAMTYDSRKIFVWDQKRILKHYNKDVAKIEIYENPAMVSETVVFDAPNADAVQDRFAFTGCVWAIDSQQFNECTFSTEFTTTGEIPVALTVYYGPLTAYETTTLEVIE